MSKIIFEQPETKSLRFEVLGELRALRERLELVPQGDPQQPFFCQLDGEKHPATEQRYQCGQCARHICEPCYQTIKNVQMANCPYCGGPYIQI